MHIALTLFTCFGIGTLILGFVTWGETIGSKESFFLTIIIGALSVGFVLSGWLFTQCMGRNSREFGALFLGMLTIFSIVILCEVGLDLWTLLCALVICMGLYTTFDGIRDNLKELYDAGTEIDRVKHNNR